jgi:hypothetical protein
VVPRCRTTAAYTALPLSISRYVEDDARFQNAERTKHEFEDNMREKAAKSGGRRRSEVNDDNAKRMSLTNC